jgi:uncharacterized protein
MTLTFVLIGLAAGILSGIFGIGGGVLIVPALTYFAKMPFKQATGTSLGALLLPVGILGAMSYYRNGQLDMRASLIIAGGLLFGAYAGARIAEVTSTTVLQRMFAVFLVVVAARMWLKA